MKKETKVKNSDKLLTEEQIEGIIGVRWDGHKFPKAFAGQAKLAIEQKAVLNKIKALIKGLE